MMRCDRLEIEISDTDCEDAQKQGHGYCGGCIYVSNPTCKTTQPLKYVNFVFSLFKDAIDSHKTALHEISKIRDKWGNHKQPRSKEFWRDLEMVARYTQEILDVRAWLTSNDLGVGSSTWVLDNLIVHGIIEDVDKDYFNVKVEEFLDGRERHNSFDPIVQAPRRVTQMSWLA